MCLKNDFAENPASDQKINVFFLMNIRTTVMYLIERRLMSFYFTVNMTTELS